MGLEGPGAADDIRRKWGVSQGRRGVGVDGYEAEPTHSRVGENRMIIDRTGVPDARAGGRTVTPLRPFAKARIAGRPEWQDVQG